MNIITDEMQNESSLKLKLCKYKKTVKSKMNIITDEIQNEALLKLKL